MRDTAICVHQADLEAGGPALRQLSHAVYCEGNPEALTWWEYQARRQALIQARQGRPQ
jgi:hypothetical protein